MSWLRGSPIGANFGKQRSRDSPPKDADPTACYDSFKKHWQQSYEIILNTQFDEQTVFKMMNNLRLVYLLFLAFACGGIFYEKQAAQSKWLGRAISSIKKDPNIFQTMIITNDETGDARVMDIIHSIQQNLPTLHFSSSYIQDDKMHEFERIQSLKHPRGSTFFLMIDTPKVSRNTSKIEELMKFVRNLATVRIRPKCLIIRLLIENQISDYEEFLRRMWADSFLDLTVVDVSKTRVMIHQLNPFIAYEKMRYSKKTPLFPDKLRNLNEHQMKVGMFKRLPFIEAVERNSTKHPINIIGKNALLAKTFSEKMNFKSLMVPSDEEFFGKFSWNRSKSTGFLYQLFHNEIQFIGVNSIIINGFNRKQMCERVLLGLEHFAVVVPVFKSKSFLVLIGRSFFYTIPLIVLIVLTSLSIERFLKFDRRIWNFLLIIQILLGVSVPQQPEKLRERIVFGYMVIICFFYSSNIYAFLTDVNFHQEKEIEFTNLRDLNNSDLDIVSEANLFEVLAGFNDQQVMSMMTKNKMRILPPEVCVKILIRERNIACVMRQSIAEHLILHHTDDEGQSPMKVIPEYLFSSGDGLLLEPGSPYVEKFRELAGLFMESGLVDKWKFSLLDYSNDDLKLQNKKVLQEIDKNEEIKIKPLLIGLFLAGCGAAFLAFICELLVDKLKKNNWKDWKLKLSSY